MLYYKCYQHAINALYVDKHMRTSILIEDYETLLCVLSSRFYFTMFSYFSHYFPFFFAVVVAS